jgi:hypothetical protein
MTGDPRLLAGVIVHEGTHFQQFLDGELFDSSLSTPEREFRAWVNELVYWNEIRPIVSSLRTPLAEQYEFTYQIALRGEGALRDFLASVYES